ncbi:MAG: AtpZ/AtpI family protein [Deltaproteobacteria bacterium]|nr:MAG: AtpZ/AtpI family protein [Deltaproteobacteria bacterium]
MDEETKKLIKSLYYLSTVGLSMALAIAIGAGIGYYVDKWLGTSPWMFFVFLGCGIAAAFRNLYIMYKKGKKYFD